MEKSIQREFLISKELTPLYDSCRKVFNVESGQKCWDIPFKKEVYEKSDSLLGEYARGNKEHSVLLVPRSACGANSYYGDMVGGPLHISPEVVEFIDPGLHADIRLRTIYSNGLKELLNRERIVEITHDHPDHVGNPEVLRSLLDPHMFVVNKTVFGLDPTSTRDFHPDKFSFKNKKLIIGDPHESRFLSDYKNLQKFEGSLSEDQFANGFEVDGKKVWFSASNHPEKGPKVAQGIGIVIKEKAKVQYTAHNTPAINYASDDTPLTEDGMTFRNDYLQTKGNVNPDILLVAGVGGEGSKDFGKHNCTLGPIQALNLLRDNPPQYLVLTQPFREEDYVSIEEALSLITLSRKQVETALEEIFNCNIGDVSKKYISSVYKTRIQNFVRDAGIQTKVFDDDKGIAFDLDEMEAYFPSIEK
jgi:hypothetical protein